VGWQGELDRLPRRRHRKSGGGGGLSRRNSEETRGKGGETDGTELVQLEFFLGRLWEGSGCLVGTFCPMLISTPFLRTVFF
jgi:hypothetical protein